MNVYQQDALQYSHNHSMEKQNKILNRVIEKNDALLVNSSLKYY